MLKITKLALVILTLFAVSTINAQNFLFERFDANSLAPGWERSNSGNTPDQWRLRSPFTYAGTQFTMRGSNFLFVNGDTSGSTTVMNASIVTPEMNTAAANVVLLEFYQHYRDWSGTPTDSAIVEVFDGTRWRRIQAIDQTIGTGTNPVRAQYNITQFKNANMRVRFRLVGNWPWFYAVDDIRIYQPPANDLGVASILTPSGTCGLSATTQVQVRISNFGSAAQTSIPAAYRVNNGPIVTQTFTGNLASGQTADFTFSTTSNLSAPGVYTIKAWTTLSGDLITANDTAVTTVEKLSSNLNVVTFTGFNGTNLGEISPGWETRRGWPPAPNTTTAWRASNTAQTTALGSITGTINLFTIGKRDWIISPSFSAGPFTGLVFKAAVTRWQNTDPAQLGSDDSLKVFVSTNCGASWQLVYAITRANNLPNQLVEFIVPLAQFNGQDISIGLMATEGLIDDPEDIDLHIDDIQIRNLAENDVSVSAINSPVSGCSNVIPNLNVTVRNTGINAQSNFPVCFSIDGAAPVCQTFTGTLQSNEQATFNLTDANPILSNPGNYRITVFTNLNTEQNRANDTIKNYQYQNIPLISSFPYFESFETNNGGWIPGGALTSWALGTPNKARIQGAAHGTRAYVTGGLGNGTYNNNEKSFVLGPCMDFTTLLNPMFEMRAWWHSDLNDGAALQFTTNSGVTWVTAGQLEAVTNWYNTTLINGLTGLANNPRNGWAGGLGNNAGSNGWVLVRTALPMLAGLPNVRFRIVFGADAQVTADGFAFDAIRIEERANIDIAVARIDRPLFPGCGLTEEVRPRFTIQNQGKDSINNITFSYRVNNGPIVNETATVNGFTTNTFRTYTFNTPVNMSILANNVIEVWAKAAGDPVTQNDSLKVKLSRPSVFTDTIRFNGFNNVNLGQLWTGWSVANGSPLPNNPVGQWRAPQPSQIPYVTARSIRLNLFGNNRNEWILSPAYRIEPNTFLTFELATTALFDTINDPNGGFNGTDDRLRIMVTTNCGDTWTEVQSFGSGDNIDRVFKRFSVNFGAYAGQEIRFAFFATTGPVANVNNYDMFIRDIYIQNLAPIDAGVTAILSPAVSCGLTATTPIRVAVRNFGSTPLSNFPIFYQVNNGNQILSNFSGTLAPQTTAEFTFPQTANLSLSQPYEIVAGTLVQGDDVLLNNNASVSLTKFTAPLNPQPLTNFNGSNLPLVWPGWSEGVGNGPTPADAAWTQGNIGGLAAFRISLTAAQLNDWVVSPGIRLSNANVLTFNAGQFQLGGTGAAQWDIDDSVTVLISTNCGTTWTKLLKLGAQTVPQLTNSMQQYSIPLDAYNNQEVRFAFRARDGIRADFPSDVYINEIAITSSLLRDVGPIEVLFTPVVEQNTFLLDTLYNVSVRVSNFGANPQSNFPLTIRFASGTQLTTNVSQTIAPSQQLLIPMGNYTPFIPGNDLRMRIFTALANDQNRANDTLIFVYNVASEVSNKLKVSNAALKFYPNPAHRVLNISGLKEGQNYAIEIKDLLGRVVAKQTVLADAYGEISTPVNTLPSGQYLISIISHNEHHRSMFIKR